MVVKIVFLECDGTDIVSTEVLETFSVEIFTSGGKRKLEKDFPGRAYPFQGKRADMKKNRWTLSS